MPNFLYGTARTRFLWGGIAWSTSTFGILFLNGSAAAGGSANPSYNVTGVGTTGWTGANILSGPFVSDVLTGWRARGAASSANTAMDLNSRSYISSGSVSATVFAPAGNAGYLSTIDGAARGNNITFASVAQSFGTLTAFLLFRDQGGAETNNDLIAYFDQATNLPIPTNGGDITIQWSTTALSDFIFKL